MSEVKLRMKFGIVEFEVEADAGTVERERKEFLETLPKLLSVQTLYTEKVNTINSDSDTKLLEGRLSDNKTDLPKNINIFLNEKEFNTDIDICLAFIYYMSEYENQSDIDSSKIKERMKEAKRNIPTNLSECIRQLAKRGYIQQAGKAEKGCINYYITVEGKEYVESYVKSDKKKDTIRKKSSSSSTSKSIESNYASITREDLNLEKYPSVNDMKSTKDKIMLTMYIFTQEGKGEYFTVNDLLYIMPNIFNERMTIDMVKGLFKNKATAQNFNKRNVQGSKKSNEFKLLNPAIKYVESEIINKNITQ